MSSIARATSYTIMALALVLAAAWTAEAWQRGYVLVATVGVGLVITLLVLLIKGPEK